MANDGLIDIAKADLMLLQQLEGFFGLPGSVTEFDNERIVGETFDKSSEMGKGFNGAVERERELKKYGAELACLLENVEPGAYGAFVLCGGVGFVGESLP